MTTCHVMPARFDVFQTVARGNALTNCVANHEDNFNTVPSALPPPPPPLYQQQIHFNHPFTHLPTFSTGAFGAIPHCSNVDARYHLSSSSLPPSSSLRLNSSHTPIYNQTFQPRTYLSTFSTTGECHHAAVTITTTFHLLIHLTKNPFNPSHRSKFQFLFLKTCTDNFCLFSFIFFLLYSSRPKSWSPYFGKLPQ